MQMSYLAGITGAGSLEALPAYYEKLIKQNRGSINQVLKRADKLNGLGKLRAKAKNKLTFNEMVSRYNKGITDDEIRAWVWYRRSIGIPMNGWEKFFIDSNTGIDENLLVTTKATTIYDNHFRELKVVPENTVLGKKLKNTHKYGKLNFLFYRDNEGVKLAIKEDVKENRREFKTDEKKLTELVKNGALYYLSGELIPYPIYAYGNMYDRELELAKDKSYIESNYGKESYQKHLAVINESKPEMLSITNPDSKQRPKILSISKFASNTENGIEISISELKPEMGISINEKTSLLSAFKDYLRSLDRQEIGDASAFEIIAYYLDNANFPRNSTAEQKAELKRNTRNEGERLFDKFLHEALTFEDQQRIDLIWNRLYNGQSNVAHHKIPIGFECSAKFAGFDFELRPAQREGIAFMEMVGSGVIAYDVGVGKTITAIAELANSIKSGKCKRPIVIVPNPTYKNWIKESVGVESHGEFIEGILSNIGIKLNDWYNLGKGYSEKIDFEKAVPENSITLVTYEGFKKIGFGEDVAEELFLELANILAQSNLEEKSARNIEIEYEKYRESVGVGLKDTIADIDKLGFDYIVIDEAHNMKNIFSTVKKNKKGQKRFGMSGQTSEAGIKAFFLCNYLQRKFGKNVMLLTATPFTNSPLEIYSMLSLVAYEGLRNMNLYSINDFFEMFILETTEDVVNYKEQIQQKDVVKSFNNRLLLQKLIYNHINYKTGDEAGVRRPCKINLPKVNEMKDGVLKRLPPSKQVLTYLKMTTRQRQNQNAITEYARSAKAKGGEILKAMNFSLNNALHPCFFDGIDPEDYNDFVKESPKIHYTLECIRSVKEYHEGRKEEVSGQVIYMNRGKDYFHLIKEYLEKEAGYKKAVKFNFKIDEVEVIDSSVSSIKKERIKEAFLAGVCKVIIGTATIREGINLQKKGTVIYNLYPDWNPTDIRQLEGRVWRQGNKYGYVRIAMPLVQDSMDVFVFQKLEEKTSRINDIWYRGDRGNVLDMESLDPEEVKFALLTDEEAIANSIIGKDIKLQERKISNIEDNIKTLKEFTAIYQRYEIYKEKVVTVMNRWKTNMEDFEYIKNLITEKDIKAKLKLKLKETSDKETQERLKKQADVSIKDLLLYSDLVKFLEKTPFDDKDLLAINRRLERRFDYYDSYTLGNYRDNMALVKKAERTVLASKGYTINDDIKKVIKEYNKDFDKESKYLDELKGVDYKEKIMQEVREKKSALKISGKTINERVSEFSSLNNLLSFKFSDIDPMVCIIPNKEKAPEVTPKTKLVDPEKEKRIRIAKVKAKAKLKLLQLSSF